MAIVLDVTQPFSVKGWVVNVKYVKQMAVLDGNAYDAKCLEAGQERDEDLEACCLLQNNKQQALLVPSGAAVHNSQSKVVVQLTVSRCYHVGCTA